MNTSGSEIKILAGNSSKELAQKIADYIGVPLADCEVGTFSDGEISVNMNETSIRDGADCRQQEERR